MADLLTYRISVGPVVDHDVVSRQLVVAVNGETTSSLVFSGSAVDLGDISVPQDASVVLTLVDIDDAGNKSEPATLEFVAADTIPPSQPGFFSVTLVGETAAPVEENTDEGSAT